MNIVYTINDRFVPQVAASICGVCENNKNMEQIRFFVIGQGISAKNQQELRSFVGRYRREIYVIELGDLSEYIGFSFDTLGWNPIVLARLLLEHLLPEEIERVLYLDGDALVIDNLQALWDTDLEGHVLGACIETTVDIKQKKQLGLENSPYVNAGVLLIDLKKWRAEKWGERILAYYRKHNGLLFANDQDAINGTLRGDIKFLPPKYNFYNIYWFYPNELLVKLMNGAYYYDEEIIEDSKDHPAIIHFLGEERPWRKGNTHKFKKEYEKYLAMTPWKDTPREEGWEAYFLCWRIFNLCTKPFPVLRYYIIRSLIPHFMKYRARQLRKNKKK